MNIIMMRNERDRSFNSTPKTYITEQVWVEQSEYFMSELRMAYIRARPDRKVNVIACALHCIAVGRAEYDLANRKWDREHWSWTDAKLTAWLSEELSKHKDAEVKRRREEREARK